MRVAELFKVWHPLPFNAVEDHHPRTRIGLRDRRGHLQQRRNVIPFHRHHVKTKGAEFAFQVEGADDFVQLAVELLFVPVHEYRQVVQSMVSDKLEGFPALPFIQFSVANDAKHPVWPSCQLVRQRHAASDGDPLPQ